MTTSQLDSSVTDDATQTPEADTASMATAPDAAQTDSAQPSNGERPRKRRRRRGRKKGAGQQPGAESASASNGAAADENDEGEAAEDSEAQPDEGEAEEVQAESAPAEPRPDDGAHLPPTAAAVRDDGAPADIDPARLDIEGLKILNRLHRYGHEAYFVGGCVRDLLVNRTPKDFDIATSAEPGQVRSLFRNCRLIGRRFRLAHIYFRGGKIIEVSTFRANPLELEDGEELPEDLLITRDNVFGTAEQDSRRRDFTINGLFYDIRKGRVIDYVDGRRDLDRKTIRTIGDPHVRMREDPVRILRAVRFAARMDFDVEPRTYSAMEVAVDDLPRCAPARLLEEVFRLLRSGYSRRCFELLDALGALRVLLPPVAEHLEKTGAGGRAELFARLAALDARIKQGSLDDSVIIAVLLAPLARSEEEGQQGMMAVDALLADMVATARLPRRIAERVRHLLWAQSVLIGERKRRKSLSSFRRHPVFPDALTVLEIGVHATGKGADALARWMEGGPVTPVAAAPGEEEQGRNKRRRSRGGRRRRGGDRGERSDSSGPPPSGGGEPS